MDKEAQRMLAPFSVMEDVEKGLRHSTTTPESTSSSSHSVVVRGTRIRLRILGIIAVTVIPVFAVMVVMLMSVIILYSVVKPDVLVVGNVTGIVNATLGTLGHAILTPDLNVRLKVSL